MPGGLGLRRGDAPDDRPAGGALAQHARRRPRARQPEGLRPQRRGGPLLRPALRRALQRAGAAPIPEPLGTAHMFSAWRIDAFVPMEEYRARFDEYIAMLHDCPPRDRPEPRPRPRRPGMAPKTTAARNGIPLHPCVSRICRRWRRNWISRSKVDLTPGPSPSPADRRTMKSWRRWRGEGNDTIVLYRPFLPSPSQAWPSIPNLGRRRGGQGGEICSASA